MQEHVISALVCDSSRRVCNYLTLKLVQNYYFPFSSTKQETMTAVATDAKLYQEVSRKPQRWPFSVIYLDGATKESFTKRTKKSRGKRDDFFQ
jgi:hypothetical protein